MNTLVHPATAFLQALPYAEVAYKDMGELQRKSVYDFMYYDGEGIWGEFVKTRKAALERYGDVKFGIGSFCNDTAFKVALRAAFHQTEEQEALDLEDWYNEIFICGKPSRRRAGPIIVNSPDTAGEFGIVQHGFDEFNEYWAFQPDVEFIRFIPAWNPIDETGRGGQ